MKKHLIYSMFLLTFGVYSCGNATETPEPEQPNSPQDTTDRPNPPVKSDVQLWLTSADQSALFQKQKVSLLFSNQSNNTPTITVDESKEYQSIDGFGYTLTDGSASLIYHLPADKRKALLEELFSTDSTFIGVSYLRISIGASDLSKRVFSYDDVSSEQTDTTLQYFDLDADKYNLIPLLKEILKINPDIEILGSPWSAPVWMKTNKSSKGGKLDPEYYDEYAQYFVKYIQAMDANGITIDAITPQNEPLNPDNNPSMVMTADEQTDFIKNDLGPAFEKVGIKTKIIIYDHNCDRPDYPITVLKDDDARKYIAGSAFHLYAGDISALSQVHKAYPQKGVYFTEQWTGGSGDFAGDLQWHVKNLIIGATRNWSKNVLEWNLASDPNYQPHTPGGCSNCMGALTIGSNITRNVSYYIIASASKFVRPGSVRIGSNMLNNLPNVAFKTPNGNKVLIVLNDSNQEKSFNIKYKGKSVLAKLEKGAVGTFVW
ncbi:MAG TPA: glycoside hydrolase family 30 beta sandwich domain-containing protein [Chitinophagaceae bacterium]|nr:glycoside hydrolase family 30 beta sandwich domain-containing protein [Chitinophagaceae bacterium]